MGLYIRQLHFITKNDKKKYLDVVIVYLTLAVSNASYGGSKMLKEKVEKEKKGKVGLYYIFSRSVFQLG